MIRFGAVSLWALLALADLGCSGRSRQKPTAAAFMRGLKTYAWYPGPVGNTRDMRIANPIVIDRVRTVIEEDLNGRGYRKTAVDNADFFITWRAAVSRSVSAATYEQARLEIYVIDPDNKKPVWLGRMQKTINMSVTATEKRQRLREAVASILDSLPGQ